MPEELSKILKTSTIEVSQEEGERSANHFEEEKSNQLGVQGVTGTA
jgi:hypothetical protein